MKEYIKLIFGFALASFVFFAIANAVVILPYQGGTGISTSTATSNCLQVSLGSTTSSLTYNLAPCGGSTTISGSPQANFVTIWTSSSSITGTSSLTFSSSSALFNLYGVGTQRPELVVGPNATSANGIQSEISLYQTVDTSTNLSMLDFLSFATGSPQFRITDHWGGTAPSGSIAIGYLNSTGTVFTDILTVATSGAVVSNQSNMQDGSGNKYVTSTKVSQLTNDIPFLSSSTALTTSSPWTTGNLVIAASAFVLNTSNTTIWASALSPLVVSGNVLSISTGTQSQNGVLIAASSTNYDTAYNQRASTTIFVAGSYMAPSGNALTVSSTVVSSTINLQITNPTTTSPSYTRGTWDFQRVFTKVGCIDNGVGTTTLVIWNATTPTSTSYNATVIGSQTTSTLACGVSGNTTTTFTSSTLLANYSLIVQVTSTAGTGTTDTVSVWLNGTKQ